MASFTLTGVNLTRIPENGGHEIQVQGTFTLANPYQVYMGRNATEADSLCYSAKPGQAAVIYPWSLTILRCYSPRLPPGVDVYVTVKDLETSDVLSLSATPIACDYQQFYSTVFGLRKPFPPFYKTGPRNIEQVDPT